MKRTPMSRGTGFKRRAPTTRAPARSEAACGLPADHAAIEHQVPTTLVRAARRGTYAAPPAAAAIPKTPRAANRHLLNMAHGKPCLIRSPICVGGTETTVACHGGGVAAGKGLGYKLHDWRTAWGCYRCNHYTDAYGGATRAQKGAAFDIGFLRQVLEWRAIVADITQPAKDRLAAQWALDHINATPVGQGDGA